MKKNWIYLLVLSVLFLWLAGFGLLSAVDRDKTVSETENRALASVPAFSLRALFSGSYISDFENYYMDQFPAREEFLSVNRWLNGFYFFSLPGNGTSLVIDYDGGGERGGESLQSAAPVTETPSDDSAAPSTSPTEEPEPEISYPDENEAVSTNSSIIIVGDNAMDIPCANYPVIQSYADAVSGIQTALGARVRTLSLLTPNSGEFYSPDSYHTGNYNQKDMIDTCYSEMNAAVITVDAYAQLRQHENEYLFFRTDHHWTALGAYYAYVAYCDAAGFTPVALSEFKTGRYENFVGTMYSYTSTYPQSQALLDNPDYVDYYLPVVEAHAKYYTDATLENGIPINVVTTNLDESVDNKYLCFISGDTPVCEITTDVDGPVCIVIKESYGNAFIPFLTSHYSKIYAIDAREFNQKGKPTLDLREFSTRVGADDVLVLDYPFMINNSFYVKLLNRLVTDSADWQ